MRKYMLLVLLFTFLVLQGLSQDEYSTTSKKAIKLFENAVNAFNNRNDDVAFRQLDEAIKADPKFIEAYLLQAEIYNTLKKYEQEIASYDKALLINPQFSHRVYYMRACADLQIGFYQEAKNDLDIFLKTETQGTAIRKKALVKKKIADFGVWAVANPVPFDPVNLGTGVNSELHEYWPSLTADEQTMIITVLVPRKGVSNKQAFSPVTHQEDLYVSHKFENEWSQKYSIGAEINTEEYNEGTQAFSMDGLHLFYTVCNKPDDLGHCDIYHSKKVGDKWLIPENIGEPVSSKAWESHPCFSSDGKTLFFASNRTGGQGEMDIWISELLSDGIWTTPVNLGDSINTHGFEMSPFIHPDNQTLYFASDGHIGLGAQDIYYSRRKPDGTWGTPVNLGYPINTYNNEKGMIVNARGDLAYFATDRLEGQRDDIYAFKLYDQAKPKFVNYVKGRIFDSDTKDGLEANIELSDLDSARKVVDGTSNSESGSYLICLPDGKNYAFNVFKKGYMFHSENFSLEGTDKEEPFRLDVGMKKIRKDETMVLKNIFYDTDAYTLKPESRVELEKLIRFMGDNPKIKVEIGGHTDNVGSKDHNKKLSQNRAHTVYTYLVDHGISATRLSYQGYDFTLPIDTNDTPEGRANNRRTEFKIIDVE